MSRKQSHLNLHSKAGVFGETGPFGRGRIGKATGVLLPSRLVRRGSFPSGHAIGAFAIATVVAERYHERRWVPWVAYKLAGAVGFSRVTLQEHFPSDIFAGAFLGFLIAHYDVLQAHSP